MPSVLFTDRFWVGAAERAAKSAAQFAAFYLGTLVVSGGFLNVLNVDWLLLAGYAGGGALLSAVTSLGSLPMGPVGSASAVDDRPPETVGRHRAAGE